jgi:hypothetical protein
MLVTLGNSSMTLIDELKKKNEHHCIYGTGHSLTTISNPDNIKHQA